MSVQENEESVQKNENVRKEKDARLELRINSEFKEELREEAKENKSSLSEYILDIVRTRNKMYGQKNNECTDKKISILIAAILEFNKLMASARPHIPKNIDKDKIKEGVKLCLKMKSKEI